MSKFQPASKEEKAKFVAKMTKKASKKEDETATETEDHSTLGPEEELAGAFRIENPIPSCLGPIGEFIMEPDSFPKHPSILQYGKRRTGKSFTARWILYKCFSDYPFGICCTGTYYNGFWQKYIPPQLVFEGLHNKALSLLIQRQIKLISDFQKDNPGKEYKDEPSLRAFVILGIHSLNCECVGDRIVHRIFSFKKLQ